MTYANKFGKFKKKNYLCTQIQAFCVMKILIAPLNWGLGHATRCVPLIDRYLAQGDEVVLGGDGLSLQYLRQRYPHLRSIELAPLNLRYSSGKRQVWAMMIALPKLIRFSIRDHRLLKRIQAQESFDEIISDNRFGLYLSAHSAVFQGFARSFSRQRLRSFSKTVYITHQLHILFPHPYHWLEPLAARLHAWVYKHYSEVWIPDTPDHRLSGKLSTPYGLPIAPLGAIFIGPLSRFSLFINSSFSPTGAHSAQRFNSSFTLPLYSSTPLPPYRIVALFSGLEPHRTLFEQAILERYKGHKEEVLLVNGKLDKQLSDSELAYYLTHAEKIIARSGYSTIMDLDALGVLDKAELIPTPGQPEQEYLASLYLRN